MSAPFNGISTLPPQWVIDYLVGRGMPTPMVRWKYLDAAFNRGRERAFAWVRNDRIEAFMGLVTGGIARGRERFDMSWACDWSRNADAPPGVGCMILTFAADHLDNLMAVGGNHNSLPLLARMARAKTHDAGAVYHFPLRSEIILERIGRKARFLGLDRWPVISWLPLRGDLLWRRGLDARVVEGVARDIDRLLEPPDDGLWRPVYDFEYVDWQVGRCPALSSGTALSPAAGPAKAAVLFWHASLLRRRWRGVVFSGGAADDEIRAALARALREAYARGAAILSVEVGQRDARLNGLLQSAGGLKSAKSIPLFIFPSARPQPKVDDLTGLSFLDSDAPALIGD